MKRRRDLGSALEASFPPLQLHLFTALKQKTQVAHACTSWVRGARWCGGGGVTDAQEDTVRKWLVLFFFTVISASAALFYLHQISGGFVVVM